jgi:hypothetical protein
VVEDGAGGVFEDGGRDGAGLEEVVVVAGCGVDVVAIGGEAEFFESVGRIDAAASAAEGEIGGGADVGEVAELWEGDVFHT